MRKKICFLIILPILIFAACSNISTEEIDSSYVRPVEIKELEQATYPVLLEYIGIIQSKELKKYSFKSSGKINKIHVVEGQIVKKGDPLVELDTTDLNFALDAANSQMIAAKAQYDKAVKGASQEEINQAKLNVQKAQDGYDFVLDTYNDLKSLYDSGSISKQKFDEAKLQLDTSKNNLNLAKEILTQVQNGSTKEDKQALFAQYEQAKVNYEAKSSLLENSVIKSDGDGYIVDILNKEGEIIGAGYPIVIIRTDEQVVNVGLTQKDIKKIYIDMKAKITVDELKVEGFVTNLEKIMDPECRTYNVEIRLKEQLSEKEFYLGSISKVSFEIGNEKGIWVPISNIMNDGQDYVYIIEDERVVRKNISLENIYEDKVLVKGLKKGDKLVVKGMKNLREGYKVVVQ